MKKSASWIRQPDVDRASNALVANGSATFETITAYQVAQYLNADPNPSVYEKFNDWQRRQNDARAISSVDLPADMTAALKASLLCSAAETEELCLAALRSIAANLEHSSNLKAASAQRERDQAIVLRDDALTQWKNTEDHLELITQERDALLDKVDTVVHECTRLQGRLEGLEPFLEFVREAKRRPSTEARIEPEGTGAG